MPGRAESRVDPQALFKAIVDSADDAISSIDLHEEITSWNRGAERLYGYTAAEIIGRSNRILIPPDRQSEEDEVIRDVLSEDGLERTDTVRVRKDGSRVDVAVTASVIRDAGG